MGVFNIHFVAKHQKIEGEKFLVSQKNLTVPKKTERGDPLGFSNIHSVAKQQKNWRGDPFGETFFFRKKSLKMPKKNWKGGPFVLARYGMLRVKTGKTFLVQFARPNGAIIFCRTFVELFWSVQVVLRKTLTKSHDYSRLFSKEKRRLKNQVHTTKTVHETTNFQPLFSRKLERTWSFNFRLKQYTVAYAENQKLKICGNLQKYVPYAYSRQPWWSITARRNTSEQKRLYFSKIYTFPFLARSGGTGKGNWNSEERGVRRQGLAQLKAQYQIFQTRYTSFLWYE